MEEREADLVIDGETEIDDFLLASRVAELEKYQLRLHYEKPPEYEQVSGSPIVTSTIVTSTIATAGVPPPTTSIMTSSGTIECCMGEESNESSDDEEMEDDVVVVVETTPETLASPSPVPPNPSSSNPVQDEKNQSFRKLKSVSPEKWTGIPHVEVDNIPPTVPSSFPILLMGAVHSVFDNLVVVKAGHPCDVSDGSEPFEAVTRPLDLGSILCTEDRSVIGPEGPRPHWVTPFGVTFGTARTCLEPEGRFHHTSSNRGATSRATKSRIASVTGTWKLISFDILSTCQKDKREE